VGATVGHRSRPGHRRRARPVVVVLTVSFVAAACSAPATVPAAGAVPGVTSHTVTVGQVDDLTLPLAGLFKGAETGTQAYFDDVNAHGGVDGRTLKLDAADSAYAPGIVAGDTTSQIASDFALVGGFSLLDSTEEPLIRAAHMPDVAIPLSTQLADDPYVYSAAPSSYNDYPLGVLEYLKKKFPEAVKHVGIVWEAATTDTREAEAALERAMRFVGFDIVYDRGASALESTFLPDVLAMKAKGVQLFFSQQFTDTYAANMAKEMVQQNFHPVVVEQASYTDKLIPLAGSAADNIFIDLGYTLYIGQDARSVPAVALYDKWMKVADPNAAFELWSLYGWASAELFVQALRAAGRHPTRPLLLSALDKITSYNAGGLLVTSDPARNIPGSCWLLAQVRHGQFQRVAPSPKTGFVCRPGGYLTAPGWKPEVRPTVK
jgi:branched-chain amino acid transport system substrate-binding protein